MDKLVEETIIKSFVIESKQERLLFELRSPRKRNTWMWHFPDTKYLKPMCLKPVSYMAPAGFVKAYSAFTDNAEVYYIGMHYIGTLPLTQAAQNVDRGDICIVYFGHGMGYYQGEQGQNGTPRYFLSSKM